MNKYSCLLDIIIDKILFVSRRCNHNNNNTSFSKELTFIPSKLPSLLLSSVILKRSLSAKVEEETINNITPLLKNKDINILKVEAVVYYKLARDKDNKLFSLTITGIDKAYFTLIASHSSRVPVNKLYSYRSKIKYKKCCGSNTHIINNNKSDISVNSGASHTVRINSTKTLTHNEILVKLSIEYHNYADVFDKTKADELLSHRPYNHKLEFIDNYNKIELLKSRIYSMFDHKLKQVKKYLNEYLKKRFIISSYASFASSVLFAEKPNKELRFYVNYRKLNAITKRNRYSIPLIDEVLA